MPFQHSLELFFAQLGDNKNFLHRAAAPGHELEASPNRSGNAELEQLASTSNAVNHSRGDGFDLLFGGKRLQPGNQSLHIRAVCNDDPSQIDTKT